MYETEAHSNTSLHKRTSALMIEQQRSQKQQSPSPIRANLRQRKPKFDKNNIPKPKKKKKSIINGRWQIEENRRYMQFLIKNQQIFAKRNVRRTGRIFKIMQKQIRTRTAVQCRSHHQKMQKKFPSLDEILYHLKTLTDNAQAVEQTVLKSNAQTGNTSHPIQISPERDLESEQEESSDIQEMPRILEPSYRQMQIQQIRFFSYFKSNEKIN